MNPASVMKLLATYAALDQLGPAFTWKTNAYLRGPLKNLVEEKAAVIRRWVAEGKLAPVEPVHLIFSIWAVTQHYADFGVQVEAILGRRDKEAIRQAVLTILLRGLKPVR